MRPSRFAALRLLPLEDRLAPSAAVSFQAGNLTVTADNVPNSVIVQGAGGAGMKVWVVNGLNVSSEYQAGDATTLAKYQTPANFRGSYAVTGNILVTTGNSNDFVVVNVDDAAGTQALPGNLRIITGNGNDDVVLRTTNGSAGGVAGYVDAALGNGADMLTLTNLAVGSFLSANGLLTGLRVIGSGLYPGDILSISNTTVGGSVFSTGLVTLLDDSAGPNRIAGDLIVNKQILNQPWVFETADTKSYPASSAINSAYSGLLVVQAASVIEGEVVYSGSGGNDGVYLYGTVEGDVTATLGAGNNDLIVGDSRFAATPRLNSTLTVFGQNGADRVSLFDDSAVDGNVAFHLGDGTNIYDLNHAFTVNGVFGLTSGTGTDDVGTIAGVIAGNQTYSLGGGANTLVWAGTTLAERFTYTGGGGVDRLTVAGVNAFRLIVDLGAGDDFFAYGAGATVEAAELDFGAGNDIYDPSLTTVVWNTTLLNL